MSAADLRRVAGLASVLEDAAKSLELSESLEQAVSERRSTLAKLDREISAKGDALKVVGGELSKIGADADRSRRSLEERREQGIGQVEAELSRHKDGLLAAARAEQAALEKEVANLRSTKSTLLDTVDRLSQTRDSLNAEIESAKQRVSKL